MFTKWVCYTFTLIAFLGQAKAEPVAIGTKAESIQNISVYRASTIPGNEVTGHTLDFNFLQNRLALVVRWETWCIPCISEIPKLIQLQKTYGDKLVIIGITNSTMAEIDREFATSVNKLDPSTQLTGTVAQEMNYNIISVDKNERTFKALLESTGIPYAVYIGADRRVQSTSIGADPDLDQIIQKFVANGGFSQAEQEATRQKAKADLYDSVILAKVMALEQMQDEFISINDHDRPEHIQKVFAFEDQIIAESKYGDDLFYLLSQMQEEPLPQLERPQVQEKIASRLFFLDYVSEEIKKIAPMAAVAAYVSLNRIDKAVALNNFIQKAAKSTELKKSAELYSSQLSELVGLKTNRQFYQSKIDQEVQKQISNTADRSFDFSDWQRRFEKESATLTKNSSAEIHSLLISALAHKTTNPGVLQQILTDLGELSGPGLLEPAILYSTLTSMHQAHIQVSPSNKKIEARLEKVISKIN
jgi:thiol-disulfide isomerase/thioredoxin